MLIKQHAHNRKTRSVKVIKKMHNISYQTRSNIEVTQRLRGAAVRTGKNEPILGKADFRLQLTISEYRVISDTLRV